MGRVGIMSAAMVIGATLAWAGSAQVGAAATTLPANLKIMPLGDSITYGAGGNDAGYRGPLYSLLNPIAPGFQFVGASTVNSGSLPASQRQHNGYSSYATLDISNNLDGVDTTVYAKYGGADRNPNGGYWLTGGNGTGRNAVYPDVILLMVGANDNVHDASQQISLANYRTNLTTLVDKLVTLRPDARLIMADITPEPNDSTSITTINHIADAVAAEYQALGKHVSTVDMYTGFPSNGLSADNIHPNSTGYAWMADRWSGAIVSAYAVPEPNAIMLLISGGVGLIAYLRWKHK